MTVESVFVLYSATQQDTDMQNNQLARKKEFRIRTVREVLEEVTEKKANKKANDNGKQCDRHRKSNDAARAAKKIAEEAQEDLAAAKKSGVDEAEISKLKRKVEAMEALAEEARKKSRNGKQCDRRQAGNDAARAAKKIAEKAQEDLAAAKKSGVDEAEISKLKRKVEAMEALAEEARKKSRNGKQCDRRCKMTFASGFVLDTRTVFDGLHKLCKPNPTTDPTGRVSEIRQIIAEGLKKGQSAEIVVASLQESRRSGLGYK